MSNSHRLGSVASGLALLCAICAAAPQMARAAEAAAEADELARLWKELASTEPAKVSAAVRSLAARGDSAAAFLAAKLKVKRAALDTERIARLIKQLDADEWRTREKAHADLGKMGAAVVPFLREALRTGPSAEVRTRIEALLAELDAREQNDPATLRRSRAILALGRIASTRALRALKGLRPEAAGDFRQQIDAALINVAEHALPGLLDSAGAKAREGSYASAAKLCEQALAIAEAADHYGTGRIRAIRDYVRARQKNRNVPAGILAKLKANPGGQKAPSVEGRIGWAWVQGQNPLGNSGFEVKRVEGRWPTAYGVWGGDMAESVAAEQGIKPLGGRQMLRFHHTNFRSAGTSGGSQVCQVIDISKFREAVRAGRARAFASVFFNRVAGGARTDTLLGVSLIAYSGPLAQHFALSQRGGCIGRSNAAIYTDAKPVTWEKLAVGLRLPKDTDFLVIQVLAVEDVFNDLRGAEFDGHYADGAFVTLVADEAAAAPGRK